MLFNIGMLWLDDNPNRSLEEKVVRAAHYYQQKYGSDVNICYVNKTVLANPVQVGRIQVLPAPQVLPHHFWLGRTLAQAA